MSTSTGLTGSIIQAFSWMLIHSLWQGLVLALIAGIILALTKRASAAARYSLVLGLFSVFLLTVACTFVYEYGNARHALAQSQLSNNFKPVINEINTFSSSRIVIINNFHSEDTSPFYSVKNINGYLKTTGNYLSEHSFLIVMLWLVFFMVKSVLMAGNMLYMHRARRYQAYEPDGYWKERVATLCEKLQLKKAVSLLESGYLKVPVVVGYLKPVILVPVGLLAGIPAAQVEAILLHELAHIRRNDYMVNFLQNVVEAVFFFNPGLLWISARLREERENCCDDMAIAQTNNKQAYVQALISFKEYAVSMPGYALAFSGQKSSLINRVTRIVYQENKTLSIKENGIFIVGILMLSLMAFTIYPLKDTKPHVSISKSFNEQQHLKQVNVVAAAYKNTTIPKITAADARITAVGAFIPISATVQPAFDSTKVSAVHGVNGTGPNLLAIIDGKEYPKDILYKISASCLNGIGMFSPDYGLQKYGPKASDGYIVIRTKTGIVYMSAIERENLVKEYSIPKSKFYNRIALKKEDGSFDNDRIVMNLMPDGSVSHYLPHDGKAGFYIDKNFYTEETIQKVSPAIIASLTGEYGVEGSNPNVERETGYTLIFDFHTKKTGMIIPASHDTTVTKNNFLTRLVLKDKSGQLYDQLVIHNLSGNAVTTLDVSHNGKVGFYIDKDFYEEDAIKKLPPAMIASLSGGGGCRPPDLRIDKAGYESIFDFTTTKYYLAMKKDSAEFNTAEFKVNKNAPVSTFLESMPGIKIEPDGAVFYKDVIVTKLFLNNTPYAGEGILQGIQSLPASIVEKIQVKPSSEDNGRAKMINLITKGKVHLPAPSKNGSRYATWADY